MGTYINTKDVFEFLNDYTEVRGEVVGTGNNSTTIFTLDQKKLISGSETIYTDSSALTSGITTDYDEGEITFDSAPDSGSVVTMDYDYTSIPNSVVNTMITEEEAKAEEILKRNFETNSDVTEYHNVERKQKTFFTKYSPIVTASIARNKNHETSTPNWETLSSGLGNDYLMTEEDKKIGKIRFIDNNPSAGKDRLKIVYNYGPSTNMLNLAKEYIKLKTVRKVFDSTILKAYTAGNEGFSPARVEQIDDRLLELSKVLRRNEITLI